MAKGLYGIHHGAITAAMIGIVHALQPQFVDHIAVGMIFWYVSREYDQFEWRVSVSGEPWYKRVEWWDAITPLIVGLIVLNV